MLLGATIERNNCYDLIIILFLHLLHTNEENKMREMEMFIIVSGEVSAMNNSYD